MDLSRWKLSATRIVSDENTMVSPFPPHIQSYKQERERYINIQSDTYF